MVNQSSTFPQQGVQAMRFGMMAAAAACVVAAMPASAATIISETDVTGKSLRIGGCCLNTPTLNELRIFNAVAGATVNLGGFGDFNVIGNIAQDGTFEFEGARVIFGDAYGRVSQTVRVYNGASLTTFTLDRYVVSGALAAAAPEPTTWALMILGFGAVSGAMRRRRHHAPQAA